MGSRIGERRSSPISSRPRSFSIQPLRTSAFDVNCQFDVRVCALKKKYFKLKLARPRLRARQKVFPLSLPSTAVVRPPSLFGSVVSCRVQGALLYSPEHRSHRRTTAAINGRHRRTHVDWCLPATPPPLFSPTPNTHPDLPAFGPRPVLSYTAVGLIPLGAFFENVGLSSRLQSTRKPRLGSLSPHLGLNHHRGFGRVPRCWQRNRAGWAAIRRCRGWTGGREATREAATLPAPRPTSSWIAPLCPTGRAR